MNAFHYADIEVGQEVAFEVDVTKEMMDSFLLITGDDNPMHIEDAFAIEHGFKERVVYGMLTASFYSTLVGVYLPGRFALLQEVDTAFNKPVYRGDHLIVRGEVKRKRDLFKRIEIMACIVNQNDETVSRATIKAGVTL